MFDRNDDVLIADESKLMKIYDIDENELANMHIDDIIIDKITKLIVDYWKLLLFYQDFLFLNCCNLNF